ncbi:MAG: UDP-glucose 4-epimerase GalE [Synechococcaceae cyanobacterium]
MARVLITGGAGYIGSHLCLQLLHAGHELVVLDNFTNSTPVALHRVAELAGLTGWEAQTSRLWSDPQPARLQLQRGNLLCREDLIEVCQDVDAVVHLAGLKSVAESVQDPLRYWNLNVYGTLLLLQVMEEVGCRTIVFSSSASIYGMQDRVPISETAEIKPINPYASTKATVEQLLFDLVASNTGWRVACLRYFNTVGSHPSGHIGESPLSIPTNLFPLIAQVASGKRDYLTVFGLDWPTIDGTCVRDYIHVMDLADGHVAALHNLWTHDPQFLILNLGTGQGHTVQEVISAFIAASGVSIPWQAAERRPGDAAISVADVDKAYRILGWRACRTLDEMCRDSWSWLCANPGGYADVKSLPD